MINTHHHQRRYWDQLRQLKAHIEYLHLYYLASERADNSINIFLAVTSNGSIAAWAIWHEHQMLWAVIIAASQLVNAIKGHLPYNRRMKRLTEVSSNLERLLLLYEEKWFHVAEGELDNSEINALISKMKRDELEIVDKYLKASPLPDKDRLKKEARQRTLEYFATFYDGD